MCLFPSHLTPSDVEDTFAQSKWFWLEMFIAKQLLGFSERLYYTDPASVSFL